MAARQLTLARTGGWGGRRAGAGRMRVAARPQVPHRTRPQHLERHPLHLTWRCVPGLGSLRGFELFAAALAALGAASGPSFRVLHYSVQDDHVHLLVEAANRDALRAGAQGLGVRLSRAINRAVGRRGRVLADRYHVRPLRTPREVKFALAYVLQNFRKHQVRVSTLLDPCSSAAYFDGFRGISPADGPAPVVAARVWLARTGWRRHGLLAPDEAPS